MGRGAIIVAKRRADRRGETWVPRSPSEARLELERLRAKKGPEVAALERCWAQYKVLASAFADVIARFDLATRIEQDLKNALGPLSAPPLTAEQYARLAELRFDSDRSATDLLGSGVDDGPVAFMAAELEDRAVVLFLDRRQPVTTIPYLYTYCRVLLGLKTLSARDHAVAELALRPDATFPSTTDAWEQHINTWEKRLKNKELPLADVEASIRRRVAEWTPRKQRV